MLKTQKLVHDMMVALELPLPNEDGPGVQGLNFELLRNLVREEADEFCDWMVHLEAAVAEGRPYNAEWSQVIDAICDLIVVIHNTSNAMGIDVEPFFDEVHKTNMAKVGGGKRYDGKAMKPDDWQPPRILEMLEDRLKQPLTLLQAMDLLGAELAPMPPGAAVVLGMLGVKPARFCCSPGCRAAPIFGLLKAGESQEMHYHVCGAHLQEFITDAEHCTVWVLGEDDEISEESRHNEWGNVVLERFVTMNGAIQIEGPEGDYVLDAKGVPVFKLRLCEGWVVQLITISHPQPTPRRIWRVGPGVNQLIEVEE